MRAGILLIVLYWALFTIRAGLQPKVAAEVKAATYDMKRASGLEKLEHTRSPDRNRHCIWLPGVKERYL